MYVYMYIGIGIYVYVHMLLIYRRQGLPVLMHEGPWTLIKRSQGLGLIGQTFKRCRRGDHPSCGLHLLLEVR